jgi:hypothetical protein
MTNHVFFNAACSVDVMAETVMFTQLNTYKHYMSILKYYSLFVYITVTRSTAI